MYLNVCVCVCIYIYKHPHLYPYIYIYFRLVKGAAGFVLQEALSQECFLQRGPEGWLHW